MNDAASLNKLGIQHIQGTSLPYDPVKAADYFRQAAELGDARAQYNLTMLYRIGRHIPKAEAQKWARSSAELGDTDGQYMHGMFLMAHSPPEAFKWLRQSAEKGNADAQFEIGMMYLRGMCVTRSILDAQTWLAKATKARSIKAVETGFQLRLDEPTAIRLLGEANNGSTVAAFRLAKMLWLAMQFEDSIAWLEKAAAMGSPEAMQRLSDLHKEGLAVEKNADLANKWLVAAIESENYEM